MCNLCNLCNLLRDLYCKNITKIIFIKLLQQIQFGINIATFYDTSTQKGISEQFEKLKLLKFTVFFFFAYFYLVRIKSLYFGPHRCMFLVQVSPTLPFYILRTLLLSYILLQLVQYIPPPQSKNTNLFQNPNTKPNCFDTYNP